MLGSIIDIIDGKLQGDYIDVQGGLVYPVTIGKKKYPFNCKVEKCTVENAITPDTSKKSVMYWEEIGDTSITMKEGSIHYESNLLLVCWVGDIFQRKEDGELDQDLIYQLSKFRPFTEHNYYSINITPISIQKRDENVFRKWGYSEKPYMVDPYSFFSIKCKLTWNNGCRPNLILKEC